MMNEWCLHNSELFQDQSQEEKERKVLRKGLLRRVNKSQVEVKY